MDFINYKRRYKRLFLWFGYLICLFQIAAVQPLEQESVFAALTLNFVRFTNWPEGIQNDSQSINICVVGNNIIDQSFDSINDRTANDKTVNVIFLSRLSNFEQCHALFISGIKKNTLLQVLLEIKTLPILSISNQESFIDLGGMVVINNVNGKIKIQVHLKRVTKAGLKISSRLLKLTSIIDQ